MKRSFAVTGGIACGKSTVAETLVELGCEVLDTDEVAHALQAGGEAVDELARRFGAEIIRPDGGVDRRKLGARVFSDPTALADLNAIMHPRIFAETRRWLASRAEGSTSAVLVPLLYESGLDRAMDWDAVVAVVCREEEQVRRIRLRGFTEAEARARIAAQMPCEEKAARADFTIRNDGSLEDLRDEVARVLKAIKSRRSGEHDEKSEN